MAETPAESSASTRKKRGAGKVGAQAKENIQAVFTKLGGTAAMARWAKKNESDFYRIYARLLPHELTGPGGGAIQIIAQGEDAGIL